MPKFDNQKYTHPDHKKLHLFRRHNSPYWWCGFHHKGTYHRTSTKSKNKPDAESFSADWYIQKQAEIITGIIPEKIKEKNLPTVNDASIKALQEYRTFVARGVRSEQYLVSVIKYLNKHVLPYFGDMPVDKISTAEWHKFTQYIFTKQPNIANNTLHQIRNSLSICMNSAVNQGWIMVAPKLKITYKTKKNQKGRAWFLPEEQHILLKALDEHVEFQKHTPHNIGSQELRDYVKFILNTGLRVGEANNVTFNDIDIVPPKNNEPCSHIVIRNIKGKSGTTPCNANIGLNSVFNSIYERVRPKSNSENLFQVHHRDMFNVVLKNCNLKHDDNQRKRDFISLRHTYICNKIIDGVDIGTIALNCRTTTDMIDKHYAKYLSAELLPSLHARENKKIAGDVVSIADQEKKLNAFKNHIVEKLKESLRSLSKEQESLWKRNIKPIKDPKLNSENITHRGFIPFPPIPEMEKIQKDIANKITELMEISGLSFSDIEQLTKDG